VREQPGAAGNSFAAGLADPLVGLGQIVPHVLPDVALKGILEGGNVIARNLGMKEREVPQRNIESEISGQDPFVAPVIFRDGYDPKGDQLYGNDCPLNASEDITGVCGKCRRCFNGWAIEGANECLREQRARQAGS
jgi:hypothetical protein